MATDPSVPIPRTDNVKAYLACNLCEENLAFESSRRPAGCTIPDEVVFGACPHLYHRICLISETMTKGEIIHCSGPDCVDILEVNRLTTVKAVIHKSELPTAPSSTPVEETQQPPAVDSTQQVLQTTKELTGELSKAIELLKNIPKNAVPRGTPFSYQTETVDLTSSPPQYEEAETADDNQTAMLNLAAKMSTPMDIADEDADISIKLEPSMKQEKGSHRVVHVAPYIPPSPTVVSSPIANLYPNNTPSSGKNLPTKQNRSRKTPYNRRGASTGRSPLADRLGTRNLIADIDPDEFNPFTPTGSTFNQIRQLEFEGAFAYSVGQYLLLGNGYPYAFVSSALTGANRLDLASLLLSSPYLGKNISIKCLISNFSKLPKLPKKIMIGFGEFETLHNTNFTPTYIVESIRLLIGTLKSKGVETIAILPPVTFGTMSQKRHHLLKICGEIAAKETNVQVKYLKWIIDQKAKYPNMIEEGNNYYLPPASAKVFLEMASKFATRKPKNEQISVHY